MFTCYRIPRIICGVHPDFRDSSFACIQQALKPSLSSFEKVDILKYTNVLTLAQLSTLGDGGTA